MRSALTPIDRNGCDSDDGFALAAVITMITAMFLLLAALVIPLTNDVAQLRQSRYLAETRQLAESVMNELFSQAARDDSGAARPSMIGEVVPKTGTDGIQRSVDWAGPYAGWARFDETSGRYTTCKQAATDAPLWRMSNGQPVVCYFYSTLSEGAVTIVEVTTRSGCSATGTRCVFRRYQQRWKRREFVNYLIFTDQETLAPVLYGPAPLADGTDTVGLKVQRGTEVSTMTRALASNQCAETPVPLPAPVTPAGPFERSRRQTDGAIDPDANRQAYCFDTAYTDADVLDGPVHTNDKWIWFCGSPQFLGPVEVAGDRYGAVGGPGDALAKRISDFNCATGTLDPASEANLTIAEPLQLPPGISSQKKLAAYVYSSGVDIELHGTYFRKRPHTPDGTGAWEPAQIPLPSRGLIYVEGKTRVMGSSDIAAGEAHANGVTIMATDDVILGSGRVPLPANPAVTGILAGDMVEKVTAIRGRDIGFVSQGNVIIGSHVASLTEQEAEIEAAIMALGLTTDGRQLGTIYVDGWRTLANTRSLTSPPRKLNFTGSLISQYRPVFGTYTPDSSDLQTGLAKDLTYPAIAPNPPYFLKPVNAVWERLDLAEIPMRSASNVSILRPWETAEGLTPSPSRTPIGLAERHGDCEADASLSDSEGTVHASAALNYAPRCLVAP